MLAWAFSLLFQKSGAAESASSSSMRRRLPSTSKMPPENGQPALQLGHAFSQGADFHGEAVYMTRVGRACRICPRWSRLKRPSRPGAAAAYGAAVLHDSAHTPPSSLLLRSPSGPRRVGVPATPSSPAAP